jgi:hypothetical protein
MPATAAPGTDRISAASSAAMTVAVGRPLDIARLADGRLADGRLADGRLADGRLADASMLAAGSGASHPQRARRWQLAVAGVIGLVAAVTITIAVRGLARRDDSVAAAPGSGVAVAPGGAGGPVGSAPTAVTPGTSGAGTAVAAPPPAATSPSPPSRPGAPAAAPHATTQPPLLPPHIATSPPGPRAGAPSPASPRSATPSHPAAPAAPGKPAAQRADALRGAPTPLSSLDAELTQSCDATLAPAAAASIKPMTIVACWCQPRDQVHAQQAYGLLGNPHDRDAVKRACAKQGIALH